MDRSRMLFPGLFTLLALVCVCLAAASALLLAWNLHTRLELAGAAPVGETGTPTLRQTLSPVPATRRPAGGKTLTPTLALTGTLEFATPPAPVSATLTLSAEAALTQTLSGTPEAILTQPIAPESGETLTPEATTPDPLPPVGGEIVTPTLTATTAPLALDAFCIPWNRGGESGRVLRVIDGVTIEVELNGQPALVRYIGLELPEFETDFSLWQRAFEHNQELVQGQRVSLIKDRSETDSEGRLLRYVLAGARFINLQMAADGYAIAESAPPDINCDQALLEAEMQAITSQVGIWSATPMPTRTFIPPTTTVSAHGSVVIVRVAPRGNGWQDAEEYIEIYNADTQPVQLLGWTIQDDQRHIFVFPNLVLNSGDYCRVFTNLENRFHCGLSYYSLSPIWSDDGECAYLKDADGKLVDEFCYEWAERR